MLIEGKLTADKQVGFVKKKHVACIVYPKGVPNIAGNYLPLTHGGIHPPNTFWHPQHWPPTGGVKSSYTYPDRVYAILNYRRLLQ